MVWKNVWLHPVLVGMAQRVSLKARLVMVQQSAAGNVRMLLDQDNLE
jgi:hypothetical protein